MSLKNVLPTGKLVAVAVSGLLFATTASAQSSLAGNAALTTDYVWRGSSQTREKPAAQAGLKYAHESGLYASAWGSNVKYQPDTGASSEFDLIFGWSGQLDGDWMLDAYFMSYQYPGANVDLNWNEINLAATWRHNYWLAVGHSTNAMASRTTGTHLLVGGRLPLNHQWRLEGAVARYVLDSAYADSYMYGSVGAVWAFQAPFEARFTAHATDAAAKRLFPQMAGTRVEFAIQTSF